jgi:5-methyltetrahydropteroyltriglutamate--homocysteine methyltransferase
MSTSFFRADTIGSLLRPAWLIEARKALRRGELSVAGYKKFEDRAVAEAIALQERCGLDVVNDGEQRRLSFLGSLVETTEGLTRTTALTKPWREDDGGVEQLTLGLAVTGRLRRRRSLVCEEFTFARGRTEMPLKVTLPSPLMLFMFWSPEESRAVYRDPFELFADGAEVIREEIRELQRLGCEYIQIDAPELAILVDPTARHAVFEANGISPERILTDGVDLINSLADAPGIHFGLHLCRGNNDGRWLSSGGYESISKAVFGRVRNYSSFLLEYDDRRSGGFEPLADVPRDSFVVLGLVSTKKNRLESAEELRARIDEASKYFPHDQMGLSTQCGFASGIKGNPVDAAMQERKLRLVAEVAHSVWPSTHLK